MRRVINTSPKAVIGVKIPPFFARSGRPCGSDVFEGGAGLEIGGSRRDNADSAIMTIENNQNLEYALQRAPNLYVLAVRAYPGSRSPLKTVLTCTGGVEVEIVWLMVSKKPFCMDLWTQINPTP